MKSCMKSRDCSFFSYPFVSAGGSKAGSVCFLHLLKVAAGGLHRGHLLDHDASLAVLLPEGAFAGVLLYEA